MLVPKPLILLCQNTKQKKRHLEPSAKPFSALSEENNTSAIEGDPRLGEGEKMEQSSYRSTSLQFEGN